MLGSSDSYYPILKILQITEEKLKKLGLSWSVERKYPALSAINVENGKINLSKTEYFGDAYLFSKWMKKALKLGQVILTTEAPVENVAQIKEILYFKSKSNSI